MEVWWVDQNVPVHLALGWRVEAVLIEGMKTVVGEGDDNTITMFNATNFEVLKGYDSWLCNIWNKQISG